MRLVLRFAVMDRASACLLAGLCLTVAPGLPGCGTRSKTVHASVAEPPTVRVSHPQVRSIVRVIGQPSFIESYERTSIFPKLTAYIEKWNVDIGDKVKKGDTLAKLFVPELVEDLGTKNATVELDRERIDLAQKLATVAEADVKAAAAALEESRAILAKYQSEVDRWDSEVKRLRVETEKGVVDPQVLLESINQLKSSAAARDAARATIMKVDAELLSKQSDLARARVSVAVARADFGVAESEARRLKAWVGYLLLTAPYDGVIVARNANTGDFVLPATGDPTAMQRDPNLSPGNAAPIYVVDRTDVVRIFVDVAERDANYVQVGTRASVLVAAYSDDPLAGAVTRTSWALHTTSRTLRAEIDLPNPGSRLLPGMYAYAEMVIERPKVWAIPLAALNFRGDQSFCWISENGRARRIEVQRGVSDDEWIEITKRRVPAPPGRLAGKVPWTPIDGSEQVIVGESSTLTDGGSVRVEPAPVGGKHAISSLISLR